VYVDDEVYDGGCGSDENWQRLHPSCWTNSDVLDVIFHVVGKLSHDIDAVRKIRGEKFQVYTVWNVPSTQRTQRHNCSPNTLIGVRAKNVTELS